MFDILPAIEAIETQEGLVMLKTPLAADRQVFDAEDNATVVGGDVDRELLIRCEKSLLVRGSINGGERAIAKLEVGGEVVVTGSVHCGNVTAASVRLAGRTEKSRLVVEGDLFVGSELLETHVNSGDYQVRKHRLDTLNRERDQLLEEKEYLQRQLRLDEKRMDKACTVTRTPLNFNVGKIVLHQKTQVRIDLTPFYQSVAGRPETNVDLSLQEFFAKGIVGVVARSNQKYLTNNQAREKIFMQLLKQLRELIMLVHRNQMNANRLSHVEQIMGQILSELNAQDTAVHVRGTVGQNTVLEFVRPHAVHGEDGHVEIEERSARLSVEAGSDADHLSLVLTSQDGETDNRSIPCAELANVTLRVQDGNVVWNSIR